MNTSLYDLTTAMKALMESEESTNEQIEEVFGAITAKENKICHLRADLLGEIDKFKAEEKRLATIRKHMENKVERLQDYIKSSMLALEVDSVSAGTFKISISPSQGALEITDEKSIPAKYTTVEQVVTINKADVKAAIIAGEDVPGATVRAGTVLRIR